MERYPEETGWLIERMDGTRPVYFSYAMSDDETPFGGWTPLVDQAVRYARKQDADSAIRAYGWTPGHVYAAEHVWGGEKINK